MITNNALEIVNRAMAIDDSEFDATLVLEREELEIIKAALLDAPEPHSIESKIKVDYQGNQSLTVDDVLTSREGMAAMERDRQAFSPETVEGLDEALKREGVALRVSELSYDDIEIFIQAARLYAQSRQSAGCDA